MLWKSHRSFLYYFQSHFSSCLAARSQLAVMSLVLLTFTESLKLWTILHCRVVSITGNMDNIFLGWTQKRQTRQSKLFTFLFAPKICFKRNWNDYTQKKSFLHVTMRKKKKYFRFSLIFLKADKILKERLWKIFHLTTGSKKVSECLCKLQSQIYLFHLPANTSSVVFRLFMFSCLLLPCLRFCCCWGFF